MMNMLFNKVLGENEKKNVFFFFLTLKLKELFGQPNTINLCSI